ncbi:hypothetical protein Tco_1520842, partial [Tanacetum coccineum]
IPKSSETTFVAPKTRFSEKATQSNTLDTTFVASKSKINEASASKARDKVSSVFKKKESNKRDTPLNPFMLNKIRTSRLWQKWFESQPNVMWTPVNTKPHAHTNPSNTKPLVSVKRWIVILPSCPCVVSSCVADIGVFIGYSENSRGFRIYNRRTKRIMETIHVKFDELTAIASEHDCLEPELQRFNNQNSSDDLMNTPSKEDLDNLFGPMFEDYFEQKSSDTTINSAAQPTHDQEDSPSTRV